MDMMTFGNSILAIVVALIQFHFQEKVSWGKEQFTFHHSIKAKGTESEWIGTEIKFN